MESRIAPMMRATITPPNTPPIMAWVWDDDLRVVFFISAPALAAEEVVGVEIAVGEAVKVETADGMVLDAVVSTTTVDTALARLVGDAPDPVGSAIANPPIGNVE
jgi:predicted RNA methylase